MSAVTSRRTPEEQGRQYRGGVAPVSDRRALRPRWGEIEVYRILAALLVVAFHVRQSMQVAVYAPERQGLHVGSDYPYQSVAWFDGAMANVDLIVDFFFAVSGFLLALPWVRSVVNGTDRPSVRAWVAGRTARVVPLYWSLVVVVWSTRNFGWPGEWRDLLEHLTFTQWMDSRRIFYTIGPAWSLGVEIWLYPLVPLLLVVAARPVCRLSSRTARAVALCVPVLAVAAASVAWKWYVEDVRHQPHDDWAWTFGMPAKADTFCLGVLLAVLFVGLGQRRFRPWVGGVLRLAAATGLVLLARHRLAHDDDVRVYVHTLSAALFCVLLAGVVFSRPGGRITALLDRPWAVRGGALTFALYISHEALIDPLAGLGLLPHDPSLMFRNWAVFLPVSLLLALLLHHAVELPCTRLRLLLDDRGRTREYYPELRAEQTPVRPGRGADGHPVVPGQRAPSSGRISA